MKHLMKLIKRENLYDFRQKVFKEKVVSLKNCAEQRTVSSEQSLEMTLKRVTCLTLVSRPRDSHFASHKAPFLGE